MREPEGGYRGSELPEWRTLYSYDSADNIHITILADTLPDAIIKAQEKLDAMLVEFKRSKLHLASAEPVVSLAGTIMHWRFEFGASLELEN